VGGVRLFRRAWLPERPRRTLLLVHGYAEHSGRYDELAVWFASRGHAVHAYDQRGHGRSQGIRCHVRRFAEFLDDLGSVTESVREQHPALPLFLVGHSMGGLITLAFLAERQPRVAGAVVSGPALAVDAVSPLRVALAKVLGRLAPRLPLGAGLDPQGLSRDPEVVRRYLEDPLVVRTMTASLGARMLDAARRTAAQAAQIHVPLLIVHGEEDPLCAPRGSQEFYAGVHSPGSTLRLYSGLRHEIFNEPEREQVYRDLLQWLDGVPGEA